MNKSLSRKIRSQRGAMAVVASIVSFFVLLPLGLLSFEVSRLFLAQTQLRNAVDAAALAAVSAMNDADINASGQSQAQIDARVKNVALKLFRRNVVVSQILQDAIQSPTVDLDNPAEGKAAFDLVIDSANGKVTAKAAFGLKPAFSNFLGLSTATIRANSKGGFKGLTGDVVVVVDISDSMTLGTGVNGPGSYIVNRHYRKNVESGYKLTYPVAKAGTSKTPPALGTDGNHLRAIPNPGLVDFKNNSTLAFLDAAPFDVKLAALFESKRGTLNSEAQYFKKHVDQGVLGDPNSVYSKMILDKIKAGVDFRAGFQEAALSFVHPLADAKQDASAFVSELTAKNPEVHVGLIGFAPYAGGNPKRGKYIDGQDKFDSFSESASKQAIPVVNLNQAQNKAKEAISAIATATTFEGTNTTDALRVAKNMLTGSEHRVGVPQTIVLLTDGIPTSGGYKKLAKECGEAGINIQIIGFFHTGYAAKGGPRVCRKIAQAAGGNSQFYPASFQPEEGAKNKFKGYYPGSELDDLELSFKLIQRGEAALIN